MESNKEAKKEKRKSENKKTKWNETKHISLKLDNCQIVDSFVGFWSLSNYTFAILFLLTIHYLFRHKICQVNAI